MLYVISMIRTQVYLSQHLYRAIHQLAEKKRKPAAEVIRDLLQSGLDQKKSVTAKQALMEFVRIGKEIKSTGPTDLSANIDKYLYDE